jgi:hypothetical protein
VVKVSPNARQPPSSHRAIAACADLRQQRLERPFLNPGRVFGYWFDFGDDWFHQVQVDRIEQAIPTVSHPRVIRRVGEAPLQYCDE